MVRASTPERDAWVEIDVAAIRHNLTLIRGLAGTARVYVVCKGNAYGFDALRVARIASEMGMDALACGDPAEVVRLRSSGIRLPILLYGVTSPQALPSVAAYDAIVTAHDGPSLQACLAENLAFSIKLDVGFGRLGFRVEDVADLCRMVKAYPYARARGAYTHVGSTGDRTSVEEQAITFTNMVDVLEDAGWRGLERMVASSRVLIAHPQLALHAVNPGRLVYGILEPPWDNRVDARPALASIHARIIAIKRVLAGARIGYASEPLARDTILAVVPYGFGDGYPRLPTGGQVLVRGQRADIIGPRHTEHSILDVSHIPDARIGDEVTFLGTQGDDRISASELVERTGVPLIELVPRLARGPNPRETLE